MKPMNNMPPGGLGGIPLLGQQPRPEQQQQQVVAAIQQAAQQLSLGIYSRIASEYLSSRESHQELEIEQLHHLARDSHMVARCYFEGLGLAKFEETKAKEANSS